MTEVVPKLFAPFKLAGRTLANRIGMAPLTRQMAEPDGTPTENNARVAVMTCEAVRRPSGQT